MHNTGQTLTESVKVHQHEQYELYAPLSTLSLRSYPSMPPSGWNNIRPAYLRAPEGFDAGHPVSTCEAHPWLFDLNERSSIHHSDFDAYILLQGYFRTRRDQLPPLNIRPLLYLADRNIYKRWSAQLYFVPSRVRMIETVVDGERG